VWLLHDLDYTHKWRCCFAWADRPGEAEQQEEKASATSGGSGMDFSTWKGPDLLGTSQLDGGCFGVCLHCVLLGGPQLVVVVVVFLLLSEQPLGFEESEERTRGR
jgi:hypothetical protein